VKVLPGFESLSLRHNPKGYINKGIGGVLPPTLTTYIDHQRCPEFFL
jgi:hypothetical protein